MPSTEAIRAAIAARMLTVPGLGVLHLYERYTAKEAGLAALFMWQPPAPPGAAKQLRGWFIRRLTLRETELTHTSTLVAVGWQLRGFMAIQDAIASEIVMDGVADGIRAAIKADETLGGLLDGRPDPPGVVGAQLAESGPFMFGGVLCHGIRLDLTTTHIERDAPGPDDAVGDFRIFHANWDIPPHGNVLAPLPADDTADATDHVVIPE
jgi:hypothetical protein